MRKTNEILLRIREVFKNSGKSQTEIGKMIDKTPQYIWRLINVDDINPSKSVINDICRKFGVNETWLRTGQGNPETEEDIDFGKMCADIGVNDPIARAVIEKYYELSPEDKELWWKFMEKFILN